MLTNLEVMIRYAMSWVGTPYIWGGQSFAGFDCSGFVQEVLAAVGAKPPGDRTAHGLHDHFQDHGVEDEAGAGSLAFYGMVNAQGEELISHVAIFITDDLIIEAGGGDQSCQTRDDARIKSACVRVRRWNHRSDFIRAIRPDYDVIA